MNAIAHDATNGLRIAPPALTISALRKSFGANEVLRGLDLTVAKGEVLCLIGPSGSGKSTLLRCIAQLEPASAGLITIGDEPLGVELRHGRLHEVSPVRRRRQRIRMGMVFQQFNLFGHMTVMQNLIEAPVSVLGLKRAEAVARAREFLERVNLPDKGEAWPSQLSGGQQQRVAIARALMMRPEILLFDEPTSALDPELVGEVMAVITDLARDGVTMMVATHEMGFARDVAHSVAFLEGGVVVERGIARQVITAPRHERTRAFLSRML